MHASTAVAAELLKARQPTELQVLGYTLLQQLVSARCSAAQCIGRVVCSACAVQCSLHSLHVQQGSSRKLRGALGPTPPCPAAASAGGQPMGRVQRRGAQPAGHARVLPAATSEVRRCCVPRRTHRPFSLGLRRCCTIPSLPIRQVCMVLHYMADEVTSSNDSMGVRGPARAVGGRAVGGDERRYYARPRCAVSQPPPPPPPPRLLPLPPLFFHLSTRAGFCLLESLWLSSGAKTSLAGCAASPLPTSPRSPNVLLIAQWFQGERFRQRPIAAP